MAKIKGILRTGRTQQQESEEQHTGSIIEPFAEEDPLLASLEMAHFENDESKLRAQEEKVNDAEWHDHLAAHRSREELARSLVDESVREVAQTAGNSPPPQPATSKATRRAMRHYIEKIASKEADKVLKADEVNKRRLDSQAALERWQAWNEDEATDTDSGSSLQNTSPSCDGSMMERTSGRNLEYLGLGYSTTIKQYEHNRYINSDYFKGLRAGATSQSKRREEARLLRETELQADAEDLALAVQRRPHLDSKVVKFEEMKAVVDSGSTVSLSDLAGGTILYDYEPDAAIRVQAFNSSTSRGKGRGTIVGWGTDVNGVRVPSKRHCQKGYRRWPQQRGRLHHPQ